MLLWPDEMMPYQAVANHCSSLEKGFDFDLPSFKRKQIEGSTYVLFYDCMYGYEERSWWFIENLKQCNFYNISCVKAHLMNAYARRPLLCKETGLFDEFVHDWSRK